MSTLTSRMMRGRLPSPVQADAHGHRRPTARARVNGVRSAQHLHAFGDPLQAEATTVRQLAGRGARRKALAVVVNDYLDLLLLAAHGDACRAGTGMLDHVVQALLDDTVDRDLVGRREHAI